MCDRDLRGGGISLKIDFEALKQELSKDIIKDHAERYEFTWPDKSKAKLLVNSPINATLRPCKEESIDFDNTRNLYIEGDNLDVLKLLRETYLHKIDVIYIDPPYNTGNNLVYKNNFYQSIEEYSKHDGSYDEDNNLLVTNLKSNGRFHTDWLNMMYPRIKIAKDLLCEEGIIVITMDDCEIETLTILMNEIFGESNHLATIVIKNNPSGRSTVSGASIAHEYALIYGSSNCCGLGRLPRNDKQISRYKESDDQGYFEWVNFRKHGGYKEDAPTMFYPIYVKIDGTSFRIPKMEWDDSSKEYNILEKPNFDENEIYPFDEKGRARRWKWGLERALKEKSEMTVRLDRSKNYAVYIKSRMNDEGMLPLTVWDDTKYSSTEYGTNLLIELFGEKIFDYPKSIHAVIDCLRIASEKKDALILDFFSGSATTAHAISCLNVEDGGNRQYILVQIPESIQSTKYKTICDVGKERIKRSNQKILKETNSKFDVGFRVLKLDSSNMKDIFYRPEDLFKGNLDLMEDNIKEDRTPEDLLFQVMLDLGVELSSSIEERNVEGKKIFSVDNGYLIACFDENLSEDVMKSIAEIKPSPVYAVFRNSVFSSDSAASNFEQIFKMYSPNTKIKIL